MIAQAPAVLRIENAVVLQGPALRDAHYLIALGVRDVSARDGIPAPARLRFLLDTLATAISDEQSMSPAGHGDVPATVEMSLSDPLDQLSTKEAAEMLGLSTRQVRRLAFDLGVHRSPTGTFTFDRAAIEAHANARKESAA